MTRREISFVFPLLNQILGNPDLEPVRKTFVADMMGKLKPFLDELTTKEAQLFVKYGEAVSEAGHDQPRALPKQGDPASAESAARFRPITGDTAEAFKQEFKTYKNGDVNPRLNASESVLFEQLYWQSILGGAEDYPKI